MKKNDKKVFILSHIKKDSENNEDFKIIGVFTSIKQAEKAMESLLTSPGFRKNPKGFNIDPYILDINVWDWGFIDGFDAISNP